MPYSASPCVQLYRWSASCHAILAGAPRVIMASELCYYPLALSPRASGGAKACVAHLSARPRRCRAERTCMDSQVVQTIVEAFKEEGIDLVVTLPEEPTGALTRAIARDPAFTSVTVASEGSGITFCAGASIGGRRCGFVTGIAGLLVGTWALFPMGDRKSTRLN